MSTTVSNPVAAGSKTRHFKWELSEDGGTITCIAVGLPGQPRASYEVSSIHNKLRGKVLQYGLKQLLSDRTADEPDTKQKLADMAGVMEDLSEGTWSERKAAERTSAITKLIAAIARAQGLTLDKVQATIDKRKATMEPEAFKKYVAGLKENPKVKAALAAIAAEEAREAAKAAKGAPQTNELDEFSMEEAA